MISEHLSRFPEPDAANHYLVEHVNLLRTSLKHYTGCDLIDRLSNLQTSDSHDMADIDLAKAIYYAPFVVVSHNTAADPIFTYGNQTALNLFEMPWSDFTTLPSRQSAELPDRQERAQLLATVAAQGYIDNYAGVRIAKSGKRFRIRQATVWNLRDESGTYRGQAAMFSEWQYL